MLNVGDQILLRGDIKPSTCVTVFKGSKDQMYYWFENPNYEGRFLLTESEVKANQVQL